jgi:hypothetical protein
MRRILVKGHLVEISELHYLGLISNLVKGYYNLAELYYRNIISGFSDWKGVFQMPDVSQKEMEVSIVDQINDVELFDAYHSFKDQLHEIIEVDNSITEWLMGYVDLSSTLDKNSRTRLARRLNKILAKGPDGKGPQGPIWVMHPEYQVFVKGSEKIMAEMSEARQRVDQRIQYLIESSSGA